MKGEQSIMEERAGVAWLVMVGVCLVAFSRLGKSRSWGWEGGSGAEARPASSNPPPLTEFPPPLNPNIKHHCQLETERFGMEGVWSRGSLREITGE